MPSWIVPTTRAPFQKDTRGVYSRANPDPLVGTFRPGQNALWKYDAGASRSPEFSIDRSVLEVKGYVADTIAQVSSISLEGIVPSDWLGFAGWEGVNTALPEEIQQRAPPERFSKAIVANRNPHGIGVPTYFRVVCQSAYEDRQPDGTLNTIILLEPNPLSSVAECLRLVQSVIWGRRLFKTSSGLIGLDPGGAESGDKVCVLAGLSVPIVLRRQDGNEERQDHTIVGEAYLDGFMNVDIFERNKDDIETFYIR